MDSHASTTTFLTTERGVKEVHTVESAHTHSHRRVPSFYAQLLDLEDDGIVHLTAEKLVEEYEKQARMLEQIQVQTPPQSQPQSFGRKLRRPRQRRITQETWSIDDLTYELPSVETEEVSSQQKDQIMRQNSPVRHNEQSPMQQAQSAVTVHTDSAYSLTASSSSQTRITSRTREATPCKPPPRKLSIVVVGDGAVGKFHDEYDPTIEDSYCKHITVDGQDYILDLTDTSGQFEYRSQLDFMRSADGFICVYSITSLGSFREVVSYRDQIWRAKDSEHVPIMMVGNKCDLGADSDRRVGTNAVARFAERSHALFLEASAKTGKNVDSVFIELVRQIEWQRRLQDGMDGVSRGSFAEHSQQEKETRASIKGFTTNITPPVSASSRSRGRDAQHDVKNGLCGCTIM
ncbi:hypothetical protein BGZ70_005620 [Mortierella alpina]|uniref:Uncharacterized protein n=1 Tax=Mortierella alpina TaxID=64518 RepID=A0A9P6JF78_MORAP|nr:hypothetical protein BGZ70_005620 [Mortierella alpina]